MVKYFAGELRKTAEYKANGTTLEDVLHKLAIRYEYLVYGLQDEWKRLAEPVFPEPTIVPAPFGTSPSPAVPDDPGRVE